MKKIKIDIVSDVVCPWCYIGKRRIEKAMEQLKDQFEFDITYLPFELNPHIPKSGFNQQEYLIKKFGSAEKYEQITQHVTTIAAGEGLRFNFQNQSVAPNTRDAHRIIWLAKQEGKQASMKEAFLKAYFEEGVDLSKNENLASIADGVGLPVNRVLSLLNSDEGLNEVIAAEQQNYQRGVSGVPFYIVNNQYGISGAQPTEVFIRAFAEIGNKPALEGEACEVDSQVC
ncbi:MAG: DsbA family oxidoreductase [Cyclobacteriaceae bacterium]|nr:DsbA family oxidoreductase [Cyclobacteriaceae bacterium]